MYNVILVDDQATKFNQLVKIFDTQKVNLKWLENAYLINSVLSQHCDLILLDMSYTKDKGHDLGGIDVLNRLKHKEYHCPVIVLTQFINFADKEQSAESLSLKNDNFGKENEKPYFSNKLETLTEIHRYLSDRFPDYYGCILFNASNLSWIRSLKLFLKEIIPNEDVITG